MCKFTVTGFLQSGKTGKKSGNLSGQGESRTVHGKIFVFVKVREKSGKMKNWCHQMSDFQAKMHHICFPLCCTPDPTGGAHGAPPDSLAALNIAP